MCIILFNTKALNYNSDLTHEIIDFFDYITKNKGEKIMRKNIIKNIEKK